ncbi:MAG TPA: hypothetical protein VJ810_02120 [Blastocatellia bacterium]|nr:hypothetical protein [Blastocatellia bacterium]
MSEHNPHQGHGQHGHEQVESSALAPRPILLFLVILFIATSFVFVIVKGLDWGFKELDETNQGQAATQIQSGERKLPPQPLLQGAPGQGSTATKDEPTLLPLEDMERVRKETDQKLGSYGWVDKSEGVARIPINRAKDVIAEKGLLALPSATISEELQKAATARKEVLEAGSSAGRLIQVPKRNQQLTPGQDQQPNQQPAQPQDQKPQENQQRVPPQ